MRWEPIQVATTHSSGERRAALLNGGAVVLFAAFVLSSGSISPSAFMRLASTYVGIAAIIFGFAALLYAAKAVFQGGIESRWTASPIRSVAKAFSDRWRDERLFGLIWPIGLFLILMPTFNAFKQRILPDAGFALDPALAQIDRSLFGTDPGIWLHDVIGSPAMTLFLDALYHSWFVPTTLGLCVVGLCAGPRTRAQYVTAYVGVWILLGAIAAYLLPAAGPVFYLDVVGPDGAAPFLAVQDRMAATNVSTAFLTSLYNQQYLMANFGSPTLVMGGGISAIPSVHNAMAVLFALAAFRWNAIAGLAFSLFALLIWIASIYLNWHYAIDGMVGAAGAAILWFGSGRLVDRLFRTPEAGLPAPLLPPVAAA